jgi:tyrosine phenol-lyase
MRPPVHEPHKIKTVRLVSFPTHDERKRYLADAHFNVFHLTPSQLNFDMMSYGTSAMSQEQIAGQLIGDEAYAGARNFENLCSAVREVLGHTCVCPTHNLLGGIHLVLKALVPDGTGVATNSQMVADLLVGRVPARDVRTRSDRVFTGNVNLKALESVLEEQPISVFLLQAFADGVHPMSLSNLVSVREIADRRGIRLVFDGSRVIENAWYIQRHETGQREGTVAVIVRRIAKTVHVLAMDGAQDPKSTTGGILTTDHPSDHEKFIQQVVVYEGLHTYGGMSGRTMEVLARGIQEMCDEAEVQWVMHVNERFTAALRERGIPLERGCDGAYLDANRFLPRTMAHPAHAIACALYQTCGARAVPTGLAGRRPYLPIQIPRLAMTTWQLGQMVEAIVNVYRQRDRIPTLEAMVPTLWNDQLRFRSVFADLEPYEFDCYPFVIHTVERISETSRDQRDHAMREAGFNTFLLRSADVTIDLLTDSGTSAMSTDQWAAYDAARATPARSDAYLRFTSVFRETYGYEHIIPVHQGRAAEHILSRILIRPGQIVPGNMYFTTTKVHQELAGGVFLDVIVDEAHDPESEFPWKGNIDLAKLRDVVDGNGAESIAYISFEHCVNMAGGQPVAMENMKEVYRYCSGKRIPVFFDATRAVENAYFIQKRDPAYRATHIRDIVREMMLYGDGCTVSGKKDFLVNIGGLLAFKDNADWRVKAEEMLRIYEGGVMDGGLAAADLAAMARGAEEMLDDRYIRTRVEQAGFLASRLLEAGVPIVMPPGSHAIFIDAKRFLPHIDQDQYPAQRLAAEIYIETGVRVMERGNVSKGRDPRTGRNYRPTLELVRLTIPRRVYTNDHMRTVADGIIRLHKRRETIRGLSFAYEPPHLRFFQGRFVLVDEPKGAGRSGALHVPAQNDRSGYNDPARPARARA